MSRLTRENRFVLILAALTYLGLSGCGSTPPPPVQSTTVGNGVTVETVFTDSDGYTVKRFLDKGYWRYYVVPAGRVEDIIQSGKVQVPNGIPTVPKK